MIYLAQTDTTVGFLSQNLSEINAIKNRPLDQPCLITTAKFSELKNLVRVPNRFKNIVRKSKKTTFLYPNKVAVRVVKDGRHDRFLKKFTWLYSSSANLHGENFNENWAKNVADVVVDTKFSQNSSSKIFKLSQTRQKCLR
jgi:hypothetical protein